MTFAWYVHPKERNNRLWIIALAARGKREYQWSGQTILVPCSRQLVTQFSTRQASTEMSTRALQGLVQFV